MPARRSTLLVYNTADRLLRGDLFHTVTTEDVLRDLAAFPPAWPIVGVGTTNWLQRNGEVIPRCRRGSENSMCLQSPLSPPVLPAAIRPVGP